MTTNVRTRSAPARRHDDTNGCVGLESLAGHLVLSERAVNAAIRAGLTLTDERLASPVRPTHTGNRQAMFCFDPTSLLKVDIDTDWAMVGAPFVGPDKGLVYAPHRRRRCEDVVGLILAERAAGGTAASCAPSHGPARSGAPPRARSIPPHTRCAAPPHRAPLDTSLLCSTKHPGNARWTTHAVWFSAALRPRHPAALWSIFAPPFSYHPRCKLAKPPARSRTSHWLRRWVRTKRISYRMPSRPREGIA